MNLGVRLAEFDNSGFSPGRSFFVQVLWFVLQALLVSSWLPGSVHRSFLLRLFGAQIGRGVRIKPNIRVKFPWRLFVGDNTWIGEAVWIDNLDEVHIGSNCCISQGVYLCTGSHLWSSPRFDLLTRPIRIGDSAWIAAKSVIAPGVTVGQGSVLKLGSVATDDLQDWVVYEGCPATPVGNRKILEPIRSHIVHSS